MKAEELKTMRLKLGLTQRQLSEKMGVTRTSISRWEMQSETYKIPPMVEKLVMLLLAAR